MGRYGKKYAIAASMSKGKSDISNFDINAAVRKENARAARDWTGFDPKGNVYLIGNKALNYYKIGFTRSLERPDDRFKTVQQGIPFDLDVLHYWFVSHAQSFERLLHYEFQDKKIRSEWFKFLPEELPDTVTKIKAFADKVLPTADDQEEDPS